jgi:hypothetical protein
VIGTALALFGGGCEVKSDSKMSGKNGVKSQSKDKHDHDHDHDHDEKKEDEHQHSHAEHGPHGGHITHFDTSPTTHFEWAHDDAQNLLTAYFEELVSAGTKIESVEVVVTSEGSERKFPLLPVESTKIEGSVYQAKDPELLTLVGASGKDPKGVQAKLHATIDGKKESVLLVDEHHH